MLTFESGLIVEKKCDACSSLYEEQSANPFPMKCGKHGTIRLCPKCNEKGKCPKCGNNLEKQMLMF
jgi:hypothetical protein